MIIKVKPLDFCENFMSTETFTLCFRRVRKCIAGSTGTLESVNRTLNQVHPILNKPLIITCFLHYIYAKTKGDIQHLCFWLLR